MAEGFESLREYAVEFGKWVLAGIATLGSSAALWIGRRYRVDSERLEKADQYVRRLKKHKIVTRSVEHSKQLRELMQLAREQQQQNKELQELVRSNTLVIKNYDSTCQNLASLVDMRAKEHHQIRDFLQGLSNRLTIVETHLKINEQWKHEQS